MQKLPMNVWLAAALLFTSAAGAETVVVDGQVQVRASEVARPTRGMTMDAVEKRFGAPTTRHDTVGKPPITRWDYAQFSVFFEFNRVIDAVVAPSASPT